MARAFVTLLSGSGTRIAPVRFGTRRPFRNDSPKWAAAGAHMAAPIPLGHLGHFLKFFNMGEVPDPDHFSEVSLRIAGARCLAVLSGKAND